MQQQRGQGNADEFVTVAEPRGCCYRCCRRSRTRFPQVPYSYLRKCEIAVKIENKASEREKGLITERHSNVNFAADLVRPSSSSGSFIFRIYTFDAPSFGRNEFSLSASHAWLCWHTSNEPFGFACESHILAALVKYLNGKLRSCGVLALV